MTQAAPARHRRGSYTISYPEYERLADRQAAGLSALSSLAAPAHLGEGHASRALHPFPAPADPYHRRDDGTDRYRDQAVLPPRDGRSGYLDEEAERARHLEHEYDIPVITYKRRRWLAIIPLVVIAGGSAYLHRTSLDGSILKDPVLLTAWLFTVTFILVQLVLAWCQKPFSVNRRQQAELDRLRVTVVIPCYNEDPKILDRTIASLMQQTRLPDHIEVVDDGSTVDYTEIRDYWVRYQPEGVRFTWVRQANAGKKHAQSVTFTTDHDAHIFVTIDSDSALDHRAIDEGLKPFADPRIVSVAGLETAINIDRNLLTRAIGHRSLVFQLFAMSAQSVARGSVLINPGAFSLYWAPLIRKIVPAYLGETFFGVPVTLGDDTALTMYALLHGRAVHQPTAVSMPVYPETLAHHLRQWTRWMRASTIRMLWRIRYLPILSYGWFFTFYTICSFLMSVAITLAIPLAWPASRNLLLASLAALVIWPLAISLRLATIKRSDQSLLNRLIGVALLPGAALWYLVVLRQWRFYGIGSCWRQGWVTRQQVEVRLDGSHEPLEMLDPEQVEILDHSVEIPRFRDDFYAHHARSHYDEYDDYDDHSDYVAHRSEQNGSRGHYRGDHVEDYRRNGSDRAVNGHGQGYAQQDGPYEDYQDSYAELYR
jgi:hyaluronan synthase